MPTFPAYTKLLWEVNGNGGNSPVPGPGPATGLRWIIIDVVARAGTLASYPQAAAPWALSAGLVPIVATQPEGTAAGVTYRWRDVRQVVDFPSSLTVSSATTGWFWRVTGYELTV